MKAFQKWLLMTPMVIGMAGAYAYGGPESGMGQQQATTASTSLSDQSNHQEAMRKGPTVLTKAQMDGITAGSAQPAFGAAGFTPGGNNLSSNPSGFGSGSQGLSKAYPR